MPRHSAPQGRDTHSQTLMVSVHTPNLLSKRDLGQCAALVAEMRHLTLESTIINLTTVQALAIARVGDEIAGTVSLRTPRDIPPHDCFTVSKSPYTLADVDSELSYLAVNHRHRRLGVGHRLVASIVEAYDTSTIYAVTEIDNLPSIRIKEALGFEPTGEIIDDRKTVARLQTFILKRDRWK